MILVTGATGKIGRELVPLLLAKGAPVRALTRDPAKARFDPEVDVVRGDLDDPATLPAALKGVDAVFVLTSGHGGDGPAQEANLAAAATAAGAARLVKISTTGVHFGGTDPISSGHRVSEEIIRNAGPHWTILQPGAFMDNRFAWLKSVREEGVAYVTEGEPDSAMIHCRDIAAVAAEVLTTDGHHGATYQLTGGAALSAEQQVAVLAEAVGRPLRLAVESEQVTRARFASWGWTGPAIDGMFKMRRSSPEAHRTVFDTVTTLLGRPALTFTDWSRQHAHLFR
ncbi:NAD(P)H-binding protein [Amycolatopsis nigrescens]|uniref:NAD(P)H-binding protein n=1 Tax=Amycolatopsis nigrescens TaxID=381445 RepID=UPI000377857A|nr:NAD(P)H-binding protein [Amycolatopsis nigrescens]